MGRGLTVLLVCLICLSGFGVPAAAEGGAGVDPTTITATLEPGETQNTMITVTLPGNVPSGDVVFVFDATSSMRPVLNSMKVKGVQVMENIRKVIPDSRFGAGSFMDYPHDYSNYYGYTATYGDPHASTDPLFVDDYAWRLDHDLSGDIGEVSAALNNIKIGPGGDMPQDYTRVIYETGSYAWRDEAKKIYVIFGDAPPHAAPSGYGLFKEMTVAPYGGDPGPDEIANTADDLDYVPVIQEIAARHINIVGVYLPYGGNSYPAGNDAEVNFRYMSDQTDGLYMVDDPNTDPAVFADQIVSLINGMAKKDIKDLGLKLVEPDHPGWVTTSEPYTDVPWPSTRIFYVAVTPPEGTPDGDHTLHLDVIGDGMVLGTVTVTIHVAAIPVITTLPISIDVKPGSCPNSFNVKEKGVLPVAILGDKDLEVSAIDPGSIRLTREGSTNDGVKPIRSSHEDVASSSTKTCSCGFRSGRPDGKEDLTLKFDSQAVVNTLGIEKNEGCVRVTVTGTLTSSDPEVDGKMIQGSDYLRVLDTGSGSC